jgi:hypothetical protein
LIALTLVLVGTIGTSGIGVLAAEENQPVTTSDTVISSQEANKLAEEARLEALKLVREGINKLASQLQPTRSDIVYLGTDITFNYAEWGLYYSDEWGMVNGDCYSQSFLDIKQAEANLVYYIGSGGAACTAQVGNDFTVSGSGSQYANIYIVGSYLGGIDVAVFPGGSAVTDINFIVKDNTTGTEYSTSILHAYLDIGEDIWGDDNYNEGISILLQAGHQYSAYLELEAGIWGGGNINSDWGRFDWDSSGEGANWSYITISF